MIFLSRSGRWCNGAAEFCGLRVDQYLWPGTHNAGTGQSSGSAACAFKNQEHDVFTQLELGIRMLDVDTIYSNHISGCFGLETGHGSSPELGENTSNHSAVLITFKYRSLSMLRSCPSVTGPSGKLAGHPSHRVGDPQLWKH